MADYGAGVGMPSRKLGPSVAVVHFCPESQKVSEAVAVTKFHLMANTTFAQVLEEASRYFGVDHTKHVLRDDFGR